VNLLHDDGQHDRFRYPAQHRGQADQGWTLDSLYQYNPNQAHTNRNVMARSPEAGKLLNLGYRFTRNTLAQADVSAQWPCLIAGTGSPPELLLAGSAF